MLAQEERLEQRATTRHRLGYESTPEVMTTIPIEYGRRWMFVLRRSGTGQWWCRLLADGFGEIAVHGDPVDLTLRSD